MNKKNSQQKSKSQPTVAPSMEMDELEVSASNQEKENGEFTQVTKLVIDRVPDEDE